MNATVVECVGHRSVDDHATLCVAALGTELAAYVAGAASVGEFDSWLAARPGPARQVRRRLAAAAEMIGIFESANLSAMTAAWLREVGPSGQVPARVLRTAEDEATLKALVVTAEAWTVGLVAA